MEISPVDSTYLPEEDSRSEDSSSCHAAGTIACWAALLFTSLAFICKKKSHLFSLAPQSPESPVVLKFFSDVQEEAPSAPPEEGAPPRPRFKATPPPKYDFTSEKDKKIITDIVTFIAKNNLLKIGLNSLRLHNLGKKIKSVHPFAFLQTVCKDDKLRGQLLSIWSDKLKRNAYIGAGFGNTMSREAKKGTLNGYLGYFSGMLKIDYKPLKPLIASHKWDEFVWHLLRNTGKPKS